MANRVFFSFDYEDVRDFRANVVRNHWVTKEGRDDAAYFDASIWEEARTKGDLALKRLINSSLEGTTATCVLIGSSTYSRRWVKYEILKSIERGNGVFGVHINSIIDRYRATKTLGRNTFAFLGVQFSQDGTKAHPTEQNNSQWTWYNDLEPFSIAKAPQAKIGKHYPLTEFYQVYDWVTQDGYSNFAGWLERSLPS